MGMSLRFDAPEYLWLVPFWLGLGWMASRLRLKVSSFPRQVPIWKRVGGYWSTWMIVFLGSIGSIALSSPHLLRETSVSPGVWVLWDVSRSMRETDVPPDRQSFATEAMANAVLSLPSLRLGLIAFAADAYIVLPPTTDKEAFIFALRQVARLDLGEGTHLAAAIETALASEEEVEAYLIVSDGAHNIPGTVALQALASEAKHRGIVIHTIFVGSNGIQSFPLALRLLSQGTGGVYQERTFDLLPLFKLQPMRESYGISPFLWGVVIGGGLMMIGMMAWKGWFNVLTA
ncbi:MAG: VWA domain-containing protein [Bacteroidia bacterium]|nr:VWA domain-containing protein [Bacteroidia bacterium]MDW8015747.1 VWA domain-containing protein [Bacteroidia bacterium]